MVNVGWHRLCQWMHMFMWDESFQLNLTKMEVMLSQPSPDMVSLASSSLRSSCMMVLLSFPLPIFYLITSINP